MIRRPETICELIAMTPGLVGDLLAIPVDRGDELNSSDDAKLMRAAENAGFLRFSHKREDPITLRTTYFWAVSFWGEQLYRTFP